MNDDLVRSLHTAVQNLQTEHLVLRTENAAMRLATIAVIEAVTMMLNGKVSTEQERASLSGMLDQLKRSIGALPASEETDGSSHET